MQLWKISVDLTPLDEVLDLKCEYKRQCWGTWCTRIYGKDSVDTKTIDEVQNDNAEEAGRYDGKDSVDAKTID